MAAPCNKAATLRTPKKKTKKTIHFVSLGCPKNRVDTEVMLGVADKGGWALVDDPTEASIVVVNTCGFIGEAKRESIETIFELSTLKKTGGLEKLVVAGCLSQRYPTELSSQMPEVDHFLGSSDMLRLGEVLGGKADRMLVGNPADWVIRATDPRVITGPRASAYVKRAEGCNRKCAFCTIPQFRGKQRSRSVDDVVREVEQLAAGGVKEINLVSQDTVSYGRDLPKDEREPLADLLERVADVKGVRWARLFYLYPEKLDDRLLELVAQHPRVAKYVDMPLQHAADAMLKRMRRGHGIDRQRQVVERVRRMIPGVTFRTAFIVGHPGETDEEFDELCAFVRWAEFERVGVFRYSDEETCASHELDGKVRALTTANRYRRLMSLQRKISRKKNQALVGQELDVLVEGPSEEHDFVMAGRHEGQAPEVDGKVFLSVDDRADFDSNIQAGQLRKARVTQASDYDLVATVIDPPPKGARKAKVSLRVLGAGA